MVDADELIRALDDLLQPVAFDHVGPNGLQVPGTRAIERVATGVTAQRALFERAIEQRAQLVLVHHGLFWNFAPVGLTPLLAERLRPLFRHDVALAAYHLPLGVRRLGDWLSDRFGIEHVWIDIPNPV